MLVLALFAWWAWRSYRKPGRTDAPRDRAAERMVPCAQCGINQPVSESLLANGRYYCCAAHLRESRGEGG
ncbi:PP0621 family protein [Accumulibacter sp.]